MVMSKNKQRSVVQRYTSVAITLHWLTAAAFAFQIGLGWRMNAPHGPQTFAVYQLHKSVGISILLLTLARIAWRFSSVPPTLSESLLPVERRLAHLIHALFYILLLGLPLSGWLLVSSSKVAVPTFLYGLVPWPHLPGIASLAPSARQAINHLAAQGHAAMVWIAICAIALHVAGALKHRFVDSSDEIARMVPIAKRALSAVAVSVVLAFFAFAIAGWRIPLSPIAITSPAASPETLPSGTQSTVAPVSVAAPISGADTATKNAESAAATLQGGTAAPMPSRPSSWRVRMAASSIRFHTAWSQGPVDGGFGRWQAKISFDPQALDRSSATIIIDMASTTANDSQQQSALPGDDWFAVAAHRKATWRSSGFRHTGTDRYLANGVLTLRGVSRPLALPFILSINGDVATMTGSAKIDRTAFDVGQGEWASVADLPALVTVNIAIKADRETIKP